jgi:hypothetical protein
MSTETYLENLERKHATEIANARELEDHWCESFPGAKFIPPDRRFLWWVRNYDLRLMKYAVTITATNASPHWSVPRLGKYASAVARNIQAEANRAA